MKFFIVMAALALSASAFAEKRQITLVNYEYEGTKQWVPGNIIVKKGDDVELTLINNVPSGPHGFQIPDFKVEKVVKKGVKEVVNFKADKEGIFVMKCQMHPAHVGGQVVVLP